jgi:integrase
MARPKLDAPNYRLVRRGSRYYVRWWENGAWQRVSTGETDKRQASIWLAQFVAGRGTPEPPEQPTVSVILDGYLADRKPVVLAFETLEAATKALRRHLGDLQPDHLTKERARIYARLRRAEGHTVGPATAPRKKPTSNGTVIRELVTLRAALKWAIAARWIDRAPHIEVPRQPPPRDRWLTRDEADRLLESAKSLHVRVFLALALYTAARTGAILDLTWDRVDFGSNLIDYGIVDGGKRRVPVPIGEKLLPILREAREAATCAHVVEHGGARVASVKTGTRAAATRANLPGVTPHILRHTAATWMAMRGVPMDVIARLLGHGDVRVTQRVYAKYGPEYLRDAVAAISGPVTG